VANCNLVDNNNEWNFTVQGYVIHWQFNINQNNYLHRHETSN